ncbi:hypothetical protein FQN60_007044 [Etheostoma spectabile]|uniref:Adaptin ear-binding coat-associated protein 1 n=1 Tax=Etheostoma spectabile TaxID=54343 RepID=A0A5J5C9H8_9PERO|nr:hypothetical protein FQN60_007044 [Etheostoma spectabile]
MAAEGEYESILCMKPDVNVYRIPPRASNRAYRVTAKGQVAYIKLEDKTSGELFAQAPLREYPGAALETVSDSSRYFVLRIQDDNGRSAFIGVGFGDRGDAFDFNVALQDHFKWVKQDTEFSKSAQLGDSGPKLDLGFKEGQTITLNIGQGKKRDKPRPQGSGGFGLLPPPPGGKIAPPPSSVSSNHNIETDCLLELDSSNSNTVVQSNATPFHNNPNHRTPETGSSFESSPAVPSLTEKESGRQLDGQTEGDKKKPVASAECHQELNSSSSRSPFTFLQLRGLFSILPHPLLLHHPVPSEVIQRNLGLPTEPRPRVEERLEEAAGERGETCKLRCYRREKFCPS